MPIKATNWYLHAKNIKIPTDTFLNTGSLDVNTNHLFSRWKLINTFINIKFIFICETNYLTDRLFISVYRRNFYSSISASCYYLKRIQIPNSLFNFIIPPSLRIVGFKNAHTTFIKWDIYGCLGWENVTLPEHKRTLAVAISSGSIKKNKGTTYLPTFCQFFL